MAKINKTSSFVNNNMLAMTTTELISGVAVASTETYPER